MTVIVCTLELHLPSPSSLKEKRRILKSIVDRLRHRFNMSVAEVGDHELWQRAALGVACVGHDRRHTQQMIDKMIALVRSNPEIQLLRHDIQVV
jgi:uncharacterized protein YlxP (DUF503 family)